MQSNFKNTINRIERAAEAWRTTFDSIPDFISIHDRDFRIIRMNKPFARLFGKSPKELLGKSCHELLHASPHVLPDCPFKKLLETGSISSIEIFEPTLGMYLEIKVFPLLNEAGEINGCVHIAKNITEKKQAEEALKKAREELFQSEKMSAIGRFASGLAHEIRNPLGNIMAASQYCLGKSDQISDIVAKYLGVIIRNTEHTNKIIKDLLDFAKPRTINLEKGNISNVILTLRDLVWARCAKQEVEISLDIPEDLPQIQMDMEHLEEAFLNFITNSLDAMPNGGRLSISIQNEPGKDEVHVIFRDNGEGISERDIGKIFEPFYTTKDAGVGLGMCMAQQVIKSHQGKVFIESVEGEYTEVKVILPASKTSQPDY